MTTANTPDESGNSSKSKVRQLATKDWAILLEFFTHAVMGLLIFVIIVAVAVVINLSSTT